MKRFLNLGVILAVVLMSSFALVACSSKNRITAGTYELTSYKVDGAEKWVDDAMTGGAKTYIKSIEVSGKNLTTTDTAGTETEYKYTLDGETVEIDGNTKFTYVGGKIIWTSGSAVATYTKE